MSITFPTRRAFLHHTSTAVAGSILFPFLPRFSTSEPITKAAKRLDGSYVSPADIEKTVGYLMHEARVPGLGVAILNQGGVRYLRGFGYRDVARHKALTEDTVMAGCSFSKTAFAYMVMQLVEENLLDLDRPVFKYLPKPLPDYRNYRDLSTDDRYKKITARMILDHSTGFPNWRRFTEDGRLAIFFEPGTRFAYSGEGIDLLGLGGRRGHPGKPWRFDAKARVRSAAHETHQHDLAACIRVELRNRI